MSRSRALIVLQCAAATLVIAMSLRSAGSDPLSLWPLILALLVAGTILTGFSVWLPRGDSVDNVAPLAFTAGAYLSPAVASATIALAWVLGVLMSRRKLDLWRTFEQVSRRALLMAGVHFLLARVLQSPIGGPDLLSVLRPTGNQVNWPMLAAITVVGLLFIVIDLGIEQLHSAARRSAPYFPQLVGTINLRSWMIVAELSVAILTVLIYATMSFVGVAISTGMLLVMRQSFALLLEMRSSYTATVEVLARSLEEYDPEQRGHAERVRDLVAAAARRLGFQGKRLEDVTYAALFHDVGRLGSDDADTETERTSSAVLADVNLLSGALPTLRILDDAVDGGTSPDEKDLVGAYLIARLSEIDRVVNIGGELDHHLGDRVGARLYANTRRTVDRVIRQVERMPLEPASAGDANPDALE